MEQDREQLRHPVRESLLEYFDTQSSRFLDCLSASIETVTTDAIHDLRVAVKRLRALFSLATWLDNRFQCSEVSVTLKKAFKVAGKLRDFHVRLEATRQMAAAHSLELSEYYNYLVACEEEFRGQYLKKAGKLKSEELPGVRATLQTIFDDTKENVILFRMRQYIDGRIEDLLESHPSAVLTDADYHQIRIETKATRYGVEILQGSLPNDKELQTLNEMLRACHQALGKWHDYQVGLEHLTQYLKGHASRTLFKSDDYVTFSRVIKSEIDTCLREFDTAWSAFVVGAGHQNPSVDD